MARLTWDAAGEKVFEAGVDRGVLFVSGVGVPWNGLISVAEQTEGGDVVPHYIDGHVYLNQPRTQEFRATIEAFTYPEEFGVCEGVMEVQHGLHTTNQKKSSFGLCYRTMVGNDLEGIAHGYKLHIIYNAKAGPSDRSNLSNSRLETPENFSWDILTKPPEVVGHSPTAHFVIDSRKTPSVLLEQIEDILYGSDGVDPRLPSAKELLYLFESYQASVFDAGYLGETYYATFDSGVVPEAQTSTIDGGSP